MVVFALLFALIAPAFAAQAPKEEPKKADPPVIATDLKEKFFKAQSELSSAQLTLERTKEFQDHQVKAAAFQNLINDLVKLCGNDFQIGLDKDGDPTCLPKVPPAKVPEKK